MDIIKEELFPQRLKALREEKRMTLEQVANKVDSNKVTLSRYERGERSPNVGMVAKLANYFDVDISWLIGETDERNIKLSINDIYSQLTPPRQTKVYNFAETQLNEQNQVRLYGSVAANPEALAYADDTYHDDYVTKDVPKNADGALVVAGNSMEPDYKNGSIVFYKKQSNVENGELAVVDVDGDGATFKQVMFDYDSEKIILKSLNKDYPNREIEGNRVRIIGKVLN